MAEHLKRITLDLDGDLAAEEAGRIIGAVVEKLDQCWADTTDGPIHDEAGRHVANARLEKLPISLQLALEHRASRDEFRTHGDCSAIDDDEGLPAHG